jgi:Holliday junction resolvase
MSTASRGRALEHEIRQLFRAAGYSVIRGAGSKGELDVDGQPMKVDLVCTKTGRDVERTVFVVGIQCKLKKIASGAGASKETASTHRLCPDAPAED